MQLDVGLGTGGGGKGDRFNIVLLCSWMSAISGLLNLLLLGSVSFGDGFSDTACSNGQGGTSDEITMETVAEDQKCVHRKRKKPAANFVCNHCAQGPFTTLGLYNHYRSMPEHRPKPSQAKKVRRRSGWTYKKKKDMADQVFEAEAKGEHGKVEELSRTRGVIPSTLREWLRPNTYADIVKVNNASKSGKSRVRVFYGQNEQADQQVYLEFCRKRDLGRKVRGSWLQRVYRKRVLALTGKKVKGGSGWLRGFLKRWRISQQCRTNKKVTSVADRVTWIQAFHAAFIYGIQWTGITRCEKYGRFPGEQMFHMDQVPIQFTGTSRMTYNHVGDRSGCRLGDPSGSDAGKRFGTLQITIRAKGEQIVPLEIYFKSAKRDDEITDFELAHYASLPGVRVRFQKRAWADEGIILDYLADFRQDTLGLGEVMLAMDRHGSQKTPLVRRLMAHFSIFPLYTPPECTDVVSPCDHHVGRHLQVLISKKYEQAYDDNQTDWDSEGIQTCEKRMLFATWAAEAWQDLCTTNRYLIDSAFLQTGFLIARDGSENHLIKLQNWNGRAPYDF